MIEIKCVWHHVTMQFHSSGLNVYYSNFSCFRWFGLVSWFSLYNCFLLIGRETFDQLNDAVFPLWVTLDYMSDIAYILDIVLQFVTSEWYKYGG